MTITKKIGIMVAACTVASSIAVGALSLVDSNQFMTSNAEAIMTAECNNIAADIEAYLGKVELSVDTRCPISRLTQSGISTSSRPIPATFQTTPQIWSRR